MYERYWELLEKPFENTPDTKYFYYSQKHEEAFARMFYAIQQRKGAALLTGDYGCGKTLLGRVLRNELHKETIYTPVYILDPRLSGHEFVQEIVYQLSGAPAPESKIDLFHKLHTILYDNYKVGKHAVIVVDEAQSIRNTDTFEELRLLLNFQLEGAFLLTIVLFGSPELQGMVFGMPQLAQRMAVRYHLFGLNQNETKEYVQHRLQVSGAKKEIFDDSAYAKIHLCSNGVPRQINNICDLALLDGFINQMEKIDDQVISHIDAELNMQDPGVKA